MADTRRPAPVDYSSVAEFLAALSYPARLELLDMLRFPHSLHEIRLSPRRASSAGSRDRPAAPTTVLAHLRKLVRSGLVRTDVVEYEGKKIPRYMANPLKLYEVIEELRRISVHHAGRGPAGDATGSVTGPAAPAPVEGPRLVLVHGVYEGRAYPLRDPTAVEGQWTIGRKRGLPIALDYDPFVSLVNSAVVRRGARFHVRDLPGSKNGTAINWRLLPRGGEAMLRPGDVVGVGRSLLSFAAE